METPLSNSGKNSFEVADYAVHLAGNILTERFITAKDVNFKSEGNPVSDVDIEVEQAVISHLQSEFPSFSILSEESPPIETDSPYSWIIDPLDGTRNYISGIPHFCTTIALSKNGSVLLGITYDPIRKETFSSQKGLGAFINQSPLSVSKKQNLKSSILGLDIGYYADHAKAATKLVQDFQYQTQAIRILGSAALGLAYAASGRLDIYCHFSLEPWDLAAGILFIQEAGGVATDMQLKPADLHSKSVLVSNSALHRLFAEQMTG